MSLAFRRAVATAGWRAGRRSTAVDGYRFATVAGATQDITPVGFSAAPTFGTPSLGDVVAGVSVRTREPAAAAITVEIVSARTQSPSKAFTTGTPRSYVTTTERASTASQEPVAAIRTAEPDGEVDTAETTTARSRSRYIPPDT